MTGLSTRIIASGEHDDQIERFILSHANGQLYYRPAFMRFIRSLSSHIQTAYIAALNDDEIVGILPTAIRSSEGACILNSMPFYGSHGGALVEASAKRAAVSQVLHRALQDYMSAERVAGCTLVQNLFEDNLPREDDARFQFREHRVGQVTPLRAKTYETEELLQLFHQKTRNAARKALKSGFDITKQSLSESAVELQRTHSSNMSRVGGQAKSLDIFLKLDEALGASHSRCYVASKQGQAAGYLLLLYSGNTVEYFTPAIVDTFRSDQPLSALIIQAMQDAAEQGYTRWNWGGTWPTQDGVYRFKSRFGARDTPYFYDIRVFDEKLLSLDKATLLSRFPYFYVAPFDALKLG